MAKKFLTPVGLVALSADPVSGYDGQIYFNTQDNVLKIYHNSTWNEVSGGGGGSEGSVRTDAYLSNSWWLGV
jgi:hypothetical protein